MEWTPPRLEPQHVVETVETLGRRIAERFPESGLEQQCGDLLAVAQRAQERARAIAEPNLPLRIGAWVQIGAAVFFLITVDARLKRRRGLRALHELRAIAHIIDMHQLTVDPEQLLFGSGGTASSPRREMSAAELGRYLDYCSEMLALTGKVATIYVAELDDPVVLDAVTEVENLTTGLSREVWQKRMVLHRAQA